MYCIPCRYRVWLLLAQGHQEGIHGLNYMRYRMAAFAFDIHNIVCARQDPDQSVHFRSPPATCASPVRPVVSASRCSVAGPRIPPCR